MYFSPGGGATEAIVQALGQAQRSVYVQAYSFTSSPIAKALSQAQGRGVTVGVILDKSNATDKYSAADFLVHAGIPTFIDSARGIAHNKVMVIDEHLVITGSFNFTRAAERDNAENLLLINDAELAARYLENWRLHAEHSQIYLGKDRSQGGRKSY
ncbi:MAG: phospholipase D family nuclease [Desulfobaccales bacterium]